jgi:hypothetical protein
MQHSTRLLPDMVPCLPPQGRGPPCTPPPPAEQNPDIPAPLPTPANMSRSVIVLGRLGPTFHIPGLRDNVRHLHHKGSRAPPHTHI